MLFSFVTGRLPVRHKAEFRTVMLLTFYFKGANLLKNCIPKHWPAQGYWRWWLLKTPSARQYRPSWNKVIYQWFVQKSLSWKKIPLQWGQNQSFNQSIKFICQENITKIRRKSYIQKVQLDIFPEGNTN